MYKKPTQPQTPSINNSKKGTKVIEKAPMNVPDKKNQTNPNDFKNKDEQLLVMVKEYLQMSGYVRSYEALKNQKPNLRAKVQLTQPQLKSQLDRNHILQLFDKGNRQQFFRQTSKIFNSSQQLIRKFQFELNIYFCLYSIHPNLKKQQVIDKASTQAFKRYLDTKGADMSETNEFLTYFAIPFMPRPQEHKALAHVFTKEWITKIRNKLVQVLTNYLKSSNSFQHNSVRKISQLQEIYYGSSTTTINSSREECKENCNHSIEIDSLKKQNNDLRQVIKNYRAKFQEFTESSKINLIESNQKWFNFSREIFLIAKRHIKQDKVKLVEKYHSFFMSNVDDHIEGNEISLFDKQDLSITPDLSKQRIVLKRQQTVNQNSQIDLNRIKNVFLMASHKDKELQICMILKALKFRFTRKSEPIQRREIMIEYSRGDICGVNEENYIVQKRLLFDGGERIKVLYLKLMEMMTTDRFGLQYLAKSMKLIQNLVGIFNIEHQDSPCRKPVLGILQRVSFSKEPRMQMIKLGIIPMMFNIFKFQGNEISDFTIQFLIAMWMNLSLKKESYPYFEAHKSELISIVMEQMTSENDNIRNYLNGTIFLLLISKQIKAEALRQKLDEFVQNRLESKEGNLCAQQYNYIIKRLRGEDQQDIEENNDNSDQEQEEADAELEDQEFGSLSESSDQEYMEDDLQIAKGEEFLVKNYALLGPDAIREQLLTKSVLDETSKRLNNMTTSINRSRRLDNIFVGRGNVTVLQPELECLLNRKK